MIANAGIGIVALVATLAGALPCVLLIAVGGPIAVIGIVALVTWVVGVQLVAAALTGILQMALYRFATDGVVPGLRHRPARAAPSGARGNSRLRQRPRSAAASGVQRVGRLQLDAEARRRRRPRRSTASAPDRCARGSCSSRRPRSSTPRRSGTSATMQPPNPAPVSRAPSAPASTRHSTSASSSGVETSMSSRDDSWLASIEPPEAVDVAGAQRVAERAHPRASRVTAWRPRGLVGHLFDRRVAQRAEAESAADVDALGPPLRVRDCLRACAERPSAPRARGWSRGAAAARCRACGNR